MVGDDHGSGQIYFGATSGNATVTNTITAPNGGSYFTSTGDFIAPAHYEVLGDATSVGVIVKAAATVPNTGLGGAQKIINAEILIVYSCGLIGMSVFLLKRRFR